MAAIRAYHIATNAVGLTEIGADAVGQSELREGAVASSEVFDNSLTADDLGASSVGASELAANAVSSGHIVDGTIDHADLSSGTIAARAVAYINISSGPSVSLSRDVNVNSLTGAACGSNFCQFDLNISSSVGNLFSRYVVSTATANGLLTNVAFIDTDTIRVFVTTPGGGTGVMVVMF